MLLSVVVADGSVVFVVELVPVKLVHLVSHPKIPGSDAYRQKTSNFCCFQKDYFPWESCKENLKTFYLSLTLPSHSFKGLTCEDKSM